MRLSEAQRLRLAAGLKLLSAQQRRNGLRPAPDLRDLLEVLLSGPEGTELWLVWAEPQSGITSSVQGDSPAAVDAAQAARLMGVSVKTVRRALAAGDIPSTRLGRRVLIPREAIDEVVRGRRVA